MKTEKLVLEPIKIALSTAVLCIVAQKLKIDQLMDCKPVRCCADHPLTILCISHQLRARRNGRFYCSGILSTCENSQEAVLYHMMDKPLYLCGRVKTHRKLSCTI